MIRRFENILAPVARYYTEKVRVHGATAAGVDWNSSQSQTLRFEQLLKVADTQSPFSILDYGCGYGALVDYLRGRGCAFEYRGFDLSAEMIALARDRHRATGHCEFFVEEQHLTPADYVVASGVFNVRLQTPDEEWAVYLLYTLGRMAELCRRGFAFNVLSTYSDPERRRADLYYADPLSLFDYCKRNFSRFVSLLHDYPLYEFTILVRE